MKRLLVFLCLIVLFSLALVVSFADEEKATEAESKSQIPVTRDERLRQLQLQEAELKLEHAKTEMEKMEADYHEMQKLYENDIVTSQEVNEAREEYERAKLAYETAKLNLQKVELESLKAAWHIEIDKTRVYDEGDKKVMEITLKNTSKPIDLERTKQMIQENIIDSEVNVEVSPQIDDIYVSIKDGNTIISQPYEQWIDSLKAGAEITLKFELIKDVEDVVVAMRYLDSLDERNIHLRKEEPYISVVHARKYKSTDDRRMLELTLRNGAVAMESVSGMKKEAFTEMEPEGMEAVNEIANIIVSIKNESGAIISRPYELKIPSLKYGEEKTLNFELQENVNSVIVSMAYLKSEQSKMLYLEPDTRHISILSAVVYKGEEGRKRVRLTLKNTSEVAASQESNPSMITASEIRNIYVSLKQGKTLIAQPYEAKIDKLGYSEEQTIEFQLQKPDVEEVTVSLSYGDMQTDEREVYLQKESEEDIVTISSTRFSQEGNLGASVSFDLMLERLAENERTFQLKVINLPEAISIDFMDPQTRARFSQVKFTQAQSRRNLSLVLYIPETLDIKLLDKPMEFYVAVLSSEEAGKLGSAKRLHLSASQLTNLKGGIEKLELIPRGVGEMMLVSPNLYFEIKIGEPVKTTHQLKNTGTRHLNEIRIDAELPSNS